MSKRRHRVVCLLRTSTNLGKPGNPRLSDRITVLLHVAVGVPGQQRSHPGPLVFAVKTPEFQVTKKQKAKKTLVVPQFVN